MSALIQAFTALSLADSVPLQATQAAESTETGQIHEVFGGKVF
jgi:hypothetical protein